MAIMYADRVQVNVTSTVTGDAHLGSAILRFQTFAAAAANGEIMSTSIGKNGQDHYLGRFDNLDDAVEARRLGEIKYNREFDNY